MYTLLASKDRLEKFNLLDPQQIASAAVESLLQGSVPPDVYDFSQFKHLKPLFYDKIK